MIRSSFTLGPILLFTLLLTCSSPLYGGDPHSAYYCSYTDRLLWFINASDGHIGARGSKDSDNLNWLTGQARNVINPSFIVVSGDLTDSTNGNILGYPNGPHQEEWDQYKSILSANGIDASFYFDIPGNHDAFNDHYFSYYLANSVQGRATGRTQASWTRSGPWGKYHFLGVNTAGNDGAPFSIFWPYGDNAGLDSSELFFIATELAANQDANLTLVFGHHPLAATGNNDTYLFYGTGEFVGMMNGNGASLYGYGHTHSSSETFFKQNMADGVFYFNISSLGKDSPNHFRVTAIDCNGISSVTRTVGTWPVVLITAPTDMHLGGILNPYAYTVTNGASNPIRALVFDPAPVTQVQFRVNGGAWQPMANVDGNPSLWQGGWDASALTEGEHEVEVQATTGSGVGTDSVITYVSVGSVSGRLLTVAMGGNGSGTVTSEPAGISCMTVTCTHSFTAGLPVILSPTPGIGSLFAGWSGACAGTGNCSLTMDSNRQVTANFDSPLPARIGQTFYQSVQSAYDNASPSGDVIMLKEGMQAGPLIADKDKSVTLKGGYNPAYTGAGAETVIDGGMTLGLGSMVFEGIGFK
jgi:hypothetical protein